MHAADRQGGSVCSVGELGDLGASELLERVESEPSAALVEATARLESQRDDSDAATLWWVVGFAERLHGRFDAARDALVRAADIARRDEAHGLLARVHLTLSFVLARLGDLDGALGLLDRAEPHLEAADRARLTSQRGMIQYWQGHVSLAVATLESACDDLARHGDQLGEARVRVNVGAMLSQLARYEAAAAHLDKAVTLASDLDQHVLVANARQNLGFMDVRRGDVVGALGRFELAEAGLRRASADSYLPRLHIDHASALADAALFDDADTLLQRALEMFETQGNQIEMASGLLASAEIRLAKGDLDGAQSAADEAAQWYRKHGRDRWVALATSVALQALARSGDVGVETAQRLDETADALAENALTSDAIRARLVAAKVRGDVNATDGIDPVPADVRRAARHGRASDQILLAHIDALVAAERHDRTAIRRAISRGLRIAMSNQAALGSIETRAHAAVHGSALTVLGARLAVADGRPRELLERIEASRLMSSRLPEVRPPEDLDMAAMLTELRALNATIADPSATDEQRAEAGRARVRVERDIRRRSRTVRGDAAAVGVRDELRAALAMLGDRQLLAHAALDGRLLAVSVIDHRARLHDLGAIEGVTEMLDEIAFSLNRLNRVQGSEASRLAAAEMLFEVAAELSELLLPREVADAMAPVVVVPTAVLHDVPWGLLPPLGGRPVSVNPSVSAWARAERTRLERKAGRRGLRSVGFVAGPGLDFAEFEVVNLAKLYIDPEIVTGADATVDVCVDLLGRADLVHIACHGSFRTDNPMFSSLHLADGPLIVHDLERLARLPETVVLPACSVGTAKALQGGSLLGLATALTTLGACNVVAPLTPINDASSVTVMERLHRGLVSGEPPAQALAEAAMSHDLTDPTAAAFITLGA